MLPQWGGAFTSAETSRNYRVGNPEPLLASWGRGLTSAETSTSPSMSSAPPKLQWGRGLTSAETRGNRRQGRNLYHASMGPRTYIRGNRLPVTPSGATPHKAICERHSKGRFRAAVNPVLRMALSLQVVVMREHRAVAVSSAPPPRS